MPKRPVNRRLPKRHRVRLTALAEPSLLLYAVTLGAWLVPFVHSWSPEQLNGDFITWFFWLPALRHPELYAGDLLAQSWRPLAPPVLVGAYSLLGHCMAWASVSKLISAGVVLSFLLGSWYMGRALFPRTLGRCMFAAWVAGAAGAIVAMQGGIPRGFGPPLQVWCLALLVRNRPRGALALVVAAALLHAVSFVLLAPLYVAWLLWPENEGSPERSAEEIAARNRWRIWAAVVLTLCGLYLALQSWSAERQLGPMLSRREVLVTRPEWQAGGRFTYERPGGLLPDLWRETGRRLHEKPAADRIFQLLLIGYLAAALVGFLSGRWKLPRVVGLYLLVSLGAYVLADLLLPRLYAPNRYLQVPSLILTGAIIAGVSEWLCSSLTGRSRLAWCAGCALFAVLALPGGIHYNGTDAFGPGAPVAGVSDWLRAHLPVGGMYAAFPTGDADTLLLHTERPCLMAYKCDQGLYRDYLEESSRRLRLLFRAYYGYQQGDVVALARQTKARYLVIRRSDLVSTIPGRLYPEPHRAEILRWTAAHPGGHWFWTGPMAPRPVFQDRFYLVFDLARFRTAPSTTHGRRAPS